MYSEISKDSEVDFSGVLSSQICLNKQTENSMYNNRMETEAENSMEPSNFNFANQHNQMNFG